MFSIAVRVEFRVFSLLITHPNLPTFFSTDRTQNRYNRFGTFLAEDGWPDSQVDLAKQLLNDENCGKILIALKLIRYCIEQNVRRIK